MATVKPRLTITLEQSSYELLKRISKLQKMSVSALLGELVEAVAPSLERSAEVMEAALTASASVRTGLVAAMDIAEQAMMPQMDDLQRRYFEIMDELEQVAIAAQNGPDDPRSVITGVR